jgi:hypothetical protein
MSNKKILDATVIKKEIAVAEYGTKRAVKKVLEKHPHPR